MGISGSGRLAACTNLVDDTGLVSLLTFVACARWLIAFCVYDLNGFCFMYMAVWKDN